MSGLRFLGFAVTMFCVGSINALSPEEKSGLKEALRPFLVECADEFGVTEEQFEEAKKKGSAADIDPCFMSCFLKKTEFFDSKGNLDVEKIMEFANSHLKNEGSIKALETASNNCVKVNDEEVSDGEEGCDRAKLLFDCLMEQKKENNFED